MAENSTIPGTETQLNLALTFLMDSVWAKAKYVARVPLPTFPKNTRLCSFSKSVTQVIRGWEVALKSMMQGEVAEIFVRNDWSFATDGTRLKGLLPYTAINHALSVPEGPESSSIYRHATQRIPLLPINTVLSNCSSI